MTKICQITAGNTGNSRVFNLEDNLGNTPIKLAHEKGQYHEISKTYQNLFVDI